MHIVVCVKQVPDTTQVKIDPATNTLVRAGVESICNPYDLVAVEAAVKMTEKYGGTVSVITMGIPAAEAQLRECLSLGAHQAILISDRALAGADTLATSYTLASAVSKLNVSDPVQIVLCGKQAIDGDTAQTGPGIATRLGFTQLTYVSNIVGIDITKQTITVRREIENGSQIVEAKLPVMLTVELELGAPRYASLPNLIKAVKPSFTGLTLTKNYQLQVSGDMKTWTNQGSPFTATNTSMIYPQYFDVDNWNSLYFRVQVSP